MKSLLLFCAAVTCIGGVALAQSTQSLSVLGRADLAYRTFSVGEGVPADVKSVYDDLESVAVLPAVELRYARTLSTRHGLRMGLSYSVMGFESRPSGPLMWGCQYVDGEFDPTIDCGEGDFDRVSGYRFHYLTAPVAYTYRAISRDGGLRLELALGLEPAYFLKSNHKYDTSNGTRIAGSFSGPLHDFTIGLTSGVALSYPIKESVSLRLEPTFRYQLTPTNDGSFGTRLYTLGLAAGLSVSL